MKAALRIGTAGSASQRRRLLTAGTAVLLILTAMAAVTPAAHAAFLERSVFVAAGSSVSVDGPAVTGYAAQEDCVEDPDEDAAIDSSESSGGQYQLTLFGFADHPLLEQVQKLDINAITPLEAMQFLQEAKQNVEQGAKHR